MNRLKKVIGSTLVLAFMSTTVLSGTVFAQSVVPKDNSISIQDTVDKTELNNVYAFAAQINSIRYIDLSYGHSEERLSNIILYTRECFSEMASSDLTQAHADQMTAALLYFIGDTGQTYQQGSSPETFNDNSDLTVLKHVLAFSEQINNIKYIDPSLGNTDIRLANIIAATKDYNSRVAAGGLSQEDIIQMVGGLFYFIEETGQTYGLGASPVTF